MAASRTVFAKLGWGFAAAVTPLMVLVTGAIFFSQVGVCGALFLRCHEAVGTSCAQGFSTAAAVDSGSAARATERRPQ